MMATVGEQSARALTSEEFRNVIGHFASGVTVITTALDGADYGTTASAMTSLSLEPPMVLVCINRDSGTGRAIAASAHFAVNVLGEDHGDLAIRFATRGIDKFDGTRVRTGASGARLLEDAIAWLECRVSEQIVAATHYVFLAEVREASARAGAPLAYFRGKFGRLELSEDRVLCSEIRRRLLEGELSSVDVDELAAALAASRGSVYHALSKLASDGLLERNPGGTFTKRPAPEKLIEDVYSARRAIELGVARQLVGRVGQEDLAELRRLSDATEPWIADDAFVDVDRWIASNDALHEFVVGLAGSGALVQAYRGLGLAGLDIQGLALERQADRCLIEDHRELVEAFEAGDSERACAVIERHSRRPLELRRRAGGVA